MAEPNLTAPILPTGHDDLLDGIVREWVRVKLQHRHILNYNGANLAYNHAADIANKLQLSDRQKLGIAPFPAAPPNTVIAIDGGKPMEESKPEATPAKESALASAMNSPTGSVIGKVFGWGVLPTTAAGGLIYLGTLLAGSGNVPPATQPAAPPPVVAPTTNRGNVGLEVEGWQQTQPPR